MGAISGIVNFAPGGRVDPQALSLMHEMQRHRGSAGEVRVNPHAGFASRAPTAGRCPAETTVRPADTPALWVTFCGELFNAADLRRELERAGAAFQTGSDEEIVHRACDTWGVACLERFNGQFALAIWDPRTHTAILARDAMGIYPLHYAMADGALIFASEAKGVLAHPSVKIEVDEQSVCESLLCGTMFGGGSLFAGVRRLEPGCRLTATASGARIAKYWSLPQTITDRHDGEVRCDEELAALCEDAIKRRITSGRDWGVLLSGGTDSSALSAWALRVAPGPVQTFSIDFPNPWQGAQVDRHFADLTAERLGTTHRSFMAEPAEYFAVLERLAWHVEKPYNKAAATMHLLCAYAAPHARVVLSGEGIDEMLAGYVGARGLGLDDVLAHGRIEYFPWAPWYDSVRRLFRDEFAAPQRPLELLHDRLRDSLAGAPQSDPLNQSLYLYTTHFLRELVELHDQSGFASGVQTRFPYLDRRLVELLVSLPSDLKYRDGQTKYVFKRILKDLVPSEVLSRRKTHLPMPRDPGSVARQLALARELLLTPAARTARYFDPARLRSFLAGTGNSASDALTVWQVSMNLITLELVHRAYRL